MSVNSPPEKGFHEQPAEPNLSECATSQLRTLVASDGDVAELLESWGQRPAVVRPSRRIASLLGLRDIEDWLNTGMVRHPDIALLSNGRRLAPDRFTRAARTYGRTGPFLPDSERVIEAMRQGATLQLRPVDSWHRPALSLCHELAKTMRMRVHIVAFVSPPNEYGRRRHFDDVHVLAVQISGSKTWELYGPGNRLERQIELTAGAALYVPPGAVHCARAHGEGSVHISITLGDPSPREVAAMWIRDFLESLDPLDRISGDHAERLTAVRRWLQVMATSLQESDAEVLLNAAEEAWIEPATSPCTLQDALGSPE